MTGGASSSENLEKSLEAIKRNGFNAYITVCADEARKQAGEADSGNRPGLLSGIPVAVKDCISTAGLETTCGSLILKGYIPPYDAHVVERLKTGGAVIVGKANMDEFAMGTTCENSAFGPTLNPIDSSRVPGGSSGGSAAAVAAGEARMALGTDTGGSVRCPASFCGVVGIKPTYGLVSRYGLIAYANSLEQVGTLGRNVEDAAIALQAIAGHDSRDSTSQPGMDGVDYVGSCSAGSLDGIRVGVPGEYFGEGTQDGVESEVRKAIGVLEELGATVVETSMPHTSVSLAAYYVIAMSEASSNLARFDGLRYGMRLERDDNWHNTFSDIRARGFGPEVRRRILMGTYSLSAGYYGRYYIKALKVRTLVRRDFEKAFKEFDVLAAPTMPTVAPKLGELSDPMAMYMADVNTVPVNLAGVPAISVPCGTAGGMPVGLQLIGNLFGEQTILTAASAYETAVNDGDFQGAAT